MRLHFVAFALGAWLLQMRPALPSLAGGWALEAALAVLALAFVRHPALMLARRPLIAVAWLAAGFMWAATLAHWRLGDELPLGWEGRDVALVGVVATLPQALERGVRFELDVERVLTPQARVPRHVLVSWWNGEGRDLGEPVRAGERWRFIVRLKRPHGSVNPDGFDYEAYLLEHGIRATGYVRPRSAERLAALVHRPSYWVEAARGALRDRILQSLAGRPYAGVLAALAVGDQRAVPTDQWQTFTRTGVNHLMSISGLHITMVAGLAFALCQWLWRRSARLALMLPARKAAVIAGVCAAFGYTLLAGYAVPAQRTLYMLLVVAATLWLDSFTSATRVLAMALFAVVVLDPWAVLAPGFWLSFGAVAVILYVGTHRIGTPHPVAAWARTQWAVTVGLAPLLVALFQQVSIASPLANAFAIPLVSLGVVPLVLVGMLLPFDAVLHLAHALMAACMTALDGLSALPAAVWQQHAPPAWTVAAACAGALWLLAPRGFPARPVGLVAMLPLFLVFPPPPALGTARVTVLDVGHGLAVIVQTHGHALLYDTGPAYGPGADAGNRVVVPFLRAAGVSRLDGMIVTHDDVDHSGGALSVLQALPVDWMMTSLPDMDPLLFSADAALRCRGGVKWEWDGVRFEMLHPNDDGDARRVKDNDRSCVLRVATAAGSVLLPADIESRSESELVLHQAPALAADVLVVPHHGSRTSSTAPFVAAVGARSAVFTVGYRNRLGHPHAEIVDRYVGSGARLYRTDMDGAVLIDLPSAGAVQLQRYRAVHRRYWYDAPAGDAARLDAELAASLE